VAFLSVNDGIEYNKNGRAVLEIFNILRRDFQEKTKKFNKNAKNHLTNHI